MKDNRGGKRQGAGRKTKADELGLIGLLNSVWTLSDQKKTLKKLAEDCSHNDFHIRQESRKLLMAYRYGKPKESVDVNLAGELKHNISGEVALTIDQI